MAGAERLEVRHERLYVKVPGTDKLRKSANGRLRSLLADGWREIQRTQETDFIQVRLERTGHKPPMRRLPYIPPQQPRQRREGGFRGGDRRGPGGPGGPGGRPQQGAPAPTPPAAAPQAPAPATPAPPAAPAS